MARGDVYSVAFSPDGTSLAATGADGEVRLWDWRKGVSERSLWAGKSPGRAVAFAPDGIHLAAANQAGEIRVWDLTTGGEDPIAAATNAGPVRSLAFSPDGSGLATGDEQGAVLLWRWRSGEPIPLGTHRRWVTELAFTPDGQQLVSAGQDGTVRVWPASAQATVDLACVRVAGNSSAASGVTAKAWTRVRPQVFWRAAMPRHARQRPGRIRPAVAATPAHPGREPAAQTRSAGHLLLRSFAGQPGADR